MQERKEGDVLNFAMPKQKPCIIKVIGVGGGGGNAVKHMYNVSWCAILTVRR